MGRLGHENVITHHDPLTGLRAIVAIHSTALGPALGGCRWRPYSTEEEARDDALQLSAAMTSKAGVAGVPFGGGKAVVIGHPASKTQDELRRRLRAGAEELPFPYALPLEWLYIGRT
jgi:glutamate dehydrogenase/leucine dehydrogenase